ncbi:MAG: tRNA (adenosine(37)-N6)-threonylcarbamoyltransferase complex transferase subunit TsaD [Pseudomonadota bacterium]
MSDVTQGRSVEKGAHNTLKIEEFPEQRYDVSLTTLGIETSCDETGVAIYSGDAGLVADVVFSQVDMHAAFGGVVPELASRDHVRRLGALTKQALREAGLAVADIGAVAYTAGPGLAGALLAGAAFARSFAFSAGVPALGVHHMEAHLLAPMLEDPNLQPPFLALLVSGGHTQFVTVETLGCYRVIGESVDDAAGEAFDKVAKMLGLGYPGGPEVEALAKQGSPDHYRLPRPMTDRPGLDFSFSGLKTAVRQLVKDGVDLEVEKAAVARAFSDAVVDTFRIKCTRALEKTRLKKLVVAGGVSANQALRQKLTEVCDAQGVAVYFPALRFATDNGAMIAFAGYQRLTAGERGDLDFSVRARWPMDELAPP